MYKIQLYELAKPVGSEDNEAVEAGGADVEVAGEAIALIQGYLPTLGGPYGKWLEISVE